MDVLLSKNIKELSEAKRLSINKLANMSGMTQPTLQSILEKNDAKLSQIVSIASVLDVTVAELIGLSERYINAQVVESKEDSGLSSSESLYRELVKSKDEQIGYLKQEISRLNKQIDGTEVVKKTGGSERGGVEVISFEHAYKELLDRVEEMDAELKVLNYLTPENKEAKMSDFKELLSDFLSDARIKYLIYRMSQSRGFLKQSGSGKGTKYRISEKGLAEFEGRLLRLARENENRLIG